MDAPTFSSRHAVATLALLAVGPLAQAQHHDDRYWLHLTAFRPSIESTARSDFVATGRPGTVVRFEDELGLADRTTLPSFQAGARIGERWRLELEYFSLRREGERVTSGDIVWGDSVFPATATLGSRFDSDVLRVGAGYSFLRDERSEAGAVLGLHVTRFRLGLASLVTIGGVSGNGQAEAEEALVPLPTIGLYGRHDVADRWSIHGRIDYFAFSAGEYGGGLVNGTVALGYRISDRIGVSAGYRYVDYSLDIDKPTWRGGIDYRFSGPFVSLLAGF